MMLIEQIDFQELTVFPVQLKWGENDPLYHRQFLCDDHFVYKVWGATHLTHKIVISSGKDYIHTFRDSSAGISSLDLGLISTDNCPALFDVIWDSSANCRGYVTRRGTSVTRQDIPDDFIRKLCDGFVQRGFALNDICEDNMIMIDGKISLIDLDSPPSCLSTIDIRYDQEHGCLRRHQDGRYLDYMYRYLGID